MRPKQLKFLMSFLCVLLILPFASLSSAETLVLVENDPQNMTFIRVVVTISDDFTRLSRSC